jgi:hypothetical protein
MTEMIGYAQPLRAIGQALETLNLQSFELEPVGEEFFVRGKIAATNAECGGDFVSAATLAAIWGRLPRFRQENREQRGNAAGTAQSPIELQYTMDDVKRLEIEGQRKRTDPNQMPNQSSLSQVLRCVGAYLNLKRARLLRLWRDAESVSVEYETSLGSKLKETLVASELYDLWVRMYMQRAERLSPE